MRVFTRSAWLRCFFFLYYTVVLGNAAVALGKSPVIFNAAADSGIVSGTVRDAEDGDSLRAVRITVGRGQTVRANTRGRFRLRLPSGVQTLVFSMSGYQSRKVEVDVKAGETTTLDVGLQSIEYEAGEISVSAVAEPPAVRLMRRCLERKDGQRKNLRSYSYLLYSKFSSSSDTVTASRSVGRGDTTTLFLFESYSRGYFRVPDEYYNEIIQRRQSANVQPQSNLVAFGTNLNSTDDFLRILNEDIATPLHPDALSYYDFALEPLDAADTLTHAVRVHLKPKSGGRKLFTGYLDVDTLQAAPRRAFFKPNKAVQVIFDGSFTFEQTLRVQDIGYVMPDRMRITGSAKAALFWIVAPRLDIEIETVAYDYKFNLPFQDDLFLKRRVEVSDRASVFDSTFWKENAVLPLRQRDLDAYRALELAQENPDSTIGFNLFGEATSGLSRALARFNRRPFTGLEDLFHYNRVQGATFGLGVGTSLLPRLDGKASVGYGVSDRQGTGELRLKVFADRARRFSADAGVYKVLQRRDNPYFVTAPIITLGALLSKVDYGDYYYAGGIEAGLEAGFGQLVDVGIDEVIHPTSVRLFIRSEDQRTADVSTDFSLLNRSTGFRPNPEIIDGTMRSFGATVRYNYSPVRRLSNFGVMLQSEISAPSVLPSDFNFEQYRASLVWRTRTLPLWWLDMHLHAGYSNGAVPPQRFFSLESAFFGTRNAGLMRGLEVKEFYGDRYAMLTLEHSFGEVIPGLLRIPNVASFGLEFLLLGGLGWSQFSGQTRNYTNTALPSTAATEDKVYYEVGFGINRIFLFFRTDFVLRLSQTDTPQFSFALSTIGFLF